VPIDQEIQPGEHMVRIASQAGFLTYKPIWDDPANEALKTKCGNPNTLLAGEVITLPDFKINQVDVDTDQVHKFEVELDHLDLFVVLKDENDKPVKDIECEYPTDGKKKPADGEGKLEALDIAPALELGIIKFKYKTIDLSTRGVDPDPAATPPPTPPNPDFIPDEPVDPAAPPVFPAGDFEVLRSFALGIGYLDPLTEVSGIQGRLSNLGYYAGDIGYADEDPQALKLAIEEFEVDHKATVTGDATNKGMQDKLKAEHGC
jgi:hypothetical protein